MARVMKAAVALVLLCGVAAHASRIALEDDFSSAEFIGRGLLQRSLDCTRVNSACATCRNQRKPGSRTSELVCSTCLPNYRLRRDGLSKTCDCAPGFYMNNGACVVCTAGKFCLGGGSTNTGSTSTDCPEGLATTFAGAKSIQQCFTQAGYGRQSVRASNGAVTLASVACPIGTYNVGNNTAGCQRCAAGLTTAATLTNTTTDCKAPAGSYMDKGIGKLCPKGTYSTLLNADPACTACPTGITTLGEGSKFATDCQYAKRGFWMVNATNAEPCPLNTFNDGENLTAGQQCPACPHGWRTKDVGADGDALCLAPPGYELKSNDADITECDMGSYKADWNRNNCTVCGEGLITNTTGSVSKDACMVPAGWGIASLTPVSAMMCLKNQYGQSQNRTVSAATRCQTCPQNMGTLDSLRSDAAPANGYTDQTDCKVQPGWGLTAGGLAEQCQKGTFNAGYNREQCQSCPAGYTTATSMSTTANDCVIQPGWYMQTTINGSRPAPCDIGTWSAGGSLIPLNREPSSCTACATGFSTQTDESTSAADCHVCAAGYGGTGNDDCVQCPYDTFSFGGQKQGVPCTACAAGSASRKQSTESAMCYNQVQDCVADVFSTNATWVASTGVSTSAACATACTGDATCITYRWYLGNDGAVADKCQLLSEDTTTAGTQALYFKLNNGADYVKRMVAANVKFGVPVGTASTKSLDACLDDCKKTGDCEVASYDGTKCQLAQSELDQDWTGMWTVNGRKLISDTA